MNIKNRDVERKSYFRNKTWVVYFGLFSLFLKWEGGGGANKNSLESIIKNGREGEISRYRSQPPPLPSSSSSSSSLVRQVKCFQCTRS